MRAIKHILCGVQILAVLCVFAGNVQAKEFAVQLDAPAAGAPRAQDDFYLHVNDEWLRNTPIPPGAGKVDGFSELEQRVQERLQSIAETAVQKLAAGTANHDEQNIAAFYACIQDREGRRQAGLGRLAEPLQQLEKAQTAQDYVNQTAKLSHDWGTPALLGNFSVDRDPYENAQQVVWFDAPDTGLRPAFLLDTANAAYFAYYQDYMAAVLQLYGHSAADAAREAKGIFALQQDLAKHSLAAQRVLSAAEPLRPLSLPELQRIYRAVDVQAMLQAGQIGTGNGVKSWYVSDTAAIRRANELLTPQNLPLFKAYAVFKLLSTHSACLEDSYAALDRQYRQQLSGAAAALDTEREDLKLCENLLQESYGRQYAAQYFSPEDCAAARAYARQIIAAYRGKLEAADWLSAKTRQKAVRKLDMMKLNIGYPSAWPAYLDTIAVSAPSAGGNLIDNVLLLEEQRRRAEIASIGQPPEQELWHDMMPQAVNAFYSASDNSINFPAGILQAPLYDKDASPMQNLGGMGMLIAHEITHSFDSSGAQYDEMGRIRNWWTLSDRQDYTKRQRAIERFYGRYCFPDGSHENGQRTLLENMADLGAMSCLTDLAGGDPARLRELYTSFAMVWRERLTPAKLRERLAGEHSVSPIRVNAVLSSIDAFYTAFAVQPGDGMYVEPSERVSLW